MYAAIIKCKLLIIVFLMLVSASCGDTKVVINSKVQDYGTRGHVFLIKEKSLLETILSRLETAREKGKLIALQHEFTEKVKQRISRPIAVKGIVKASSNRSWTYDPTLIQTTDITDHRGNVIVAAGTKVNPLEKINWGKPLIFIDGDDLQQVDWVKEQDAKIVLIKGNPIELSKQLNRSVFFDQGGFLTSKFKIRAVPAIIIQENTELRIAEVMIE